MERDEAMRLVVEALGGIAPEADLGQVDPAGELADQLDLDSMDVLELHGALEELSGVAISEADRASLVTLDQLLAHLQGA